jgi:alkyl hydroperoxide reductase subunit AhpF
MDKKRLFDHATWGTLDGYISKLPEPVKLVVWGEEEASLGEREAIRLGTKLAERYEIVSFEQRMRRENYHYYPVIGVMRLDGTDEVDAGVRLIGLPAGYQINALVGAIQAVSFQGSQLEARTRIQLSRLPAGAEVDIEVFTTAENEEGPLVATLAAGLAAASPQVRAFLIAADVFPQAAVRYSVQSLPHTVIDGRVHVQGVLDEEAMLKQLGRALP